MQNLRNATQLARFVLVWFALSIGVAIASPMVRPQAMQLVCSASGTIKVVATGDVDTAPLAGHTLDCPLCAGISAPPPLERAALGLSATPSLAPRKPAAHAVPVTLAAPPPARGPPARS